MQRTLRFLGTLVGVTIASLLWFWLIFGFQRFVCKNTDSSLFIIGSPIFLLLAIIWGILSTALVATRTKRGLHYLLWAFAAGSFFFTLHYALLQHLWEGVDLSLSTLAIILITQVLILSALRVPHVARHDFREALSRWGRISATGMLGLLLTNGLLEMIPCEAQFFYISEIPRFLQTSFAWYVIWGVIPAGITALIYASETQSPRC